MLQYLRQLFEYTAYVLAPLLDARIDVLTTLAAAVVVLFLFAALVAMPRRATVAVPAPPLATAIPRIAARVAPLRGRRVRPTARPRAPAPAL